MTSIHDFIQVVNTLIGEYFPDTERYIVSGGDSIKDVVIQLRRGTINMNYSPYLLFNSSIDYEETIENLINDWKTKLEEENLC